MGGTGGGGGGENREGETSGIRELRIKYKPLPSQKRFHDSKARFKGFSGPIGSGKSQALCQEAIRLSFLNPGRMGLIGAPTYLTALHGYGIDAACAFSMELGNGDPSATAGIAQRGPLGDPVLLPTPSLQTNFSPTSLAYWQEVYLEMAAIQSSAGMVPFLQFGEVQWWYFTSDNLPAPVHDYHGMPFYDSFTTAQFLAEKGYALPVFSTNDSNPISFATEVAFLSGLVGSFTDALMSFVRTTYSTCRFEVLYPTDVNQTAFDKAINFPAASWTPSALAVLKTECFGFTFGRDLDSAEESIDFGTAYGFPATQSSHLVGISDPTTAWVKEALTAEGKRFESVVLFALDQFCLVGYALPLPQLLRRCVELAN